MSPGPPAEAPTTQRLGILALQGAFEEHAASFKQMPEVPTRLQSLPKLSRCVFASLPDPGGLDFHRGLPFPGEGSDMLRFPL